MLGNSWWSLHISPLVYNPFISIHSHFPKCHSEDPFFLTEGGNYEECWVLSDQTGNVLVWKVGGWVLDDLPARLLLDSCPSVSPLLSVYITAVAPTRFQHLTEEDARTHAHSRRTQKRMRERKCPRYRTLAPVRSLSVVSWPFLSKFLHLILVPSLFFPGMVPLQHWRWYI